MEIKNVQLKSEIVKAIKALGYSEPTLIQEQCIPEILQGRDIFGQSKTGSGKTAAFGIPILEMVQPGRGIQVLILTPTRELCVQVAEAMVSFGRYLHIKVAAVFGGVGINPQIDAIRRAEVVVGTPGRLLDHLGRRTLDLSGVRFLVLDEADKMFEMGFIEDVEEIISHAPADRQTLLFSATLSEGVYNLVRQHMRDPVVIKGDVHVDKSLLHQAFYVVRQPEKFSLLVHLLSSNDHAFSLVFTATRREADIVARNLKQNGIRAAAIHGGLSQDKRLQALNALKADHINVLVATDVAARGLDIRNVSHVYNYDVPKTSGEYVHRIGRTARAGDEGDAITLLSDRDYDNFNNVLRDESLQISQQALPEFQRVRFSRGEQRTGGFGRFQGRREGFGRRDGSGRGGQGPSGSHRGVDRGKGYGQAGGGGGHGREGFSSHAPHHPGAREGGGQGRRRRGRRGGGNHRGRPSFSRGNNAGISDGAR